MNRAALLVLAAAGLLGPAGAVPKPDIYLAYPSPTYTVAFDHVLLEGSVPTGASLSLGGRALEVGPDGLFIEWVPLRPGLNLLKLESRLGAGRASREVRVTSRPRFPLPQRPTAIRAGSVTPGQALVFYAGPETVPVAFEGARGGLASFKVGPRGPFPLVERTPGRYEGGFALAAGDRFEELPVTVRLTGRDGKTVLATAPGRLSARSSAGGRVAVTTEAVEARDGPGSGADRVLFPGPGVRFQIVGEAGGDLRARLAPGREVYIARSSLRLEPAGTPPPRATVESVEVQPGDGLTRLRFASTAAVPYAVEQVASGPDQRLRLRLYGGSSAPGALSLPDGPVSVLRWSTGPDGVFTAELTMRVGQQWGHKVFYEHGALVLEIKHPPGVDPVFPLLGRPITVDPGHGGAAKGAPGALRVPEKDLVLSISLLLAERLRELGAVVTLTRETDLDVSLVERPRMAEAAGAEVLVSVHANALPDGTSPRGPRGSGVYYLQPQARGLAETLQAALVRALAEVGDDGIFERNFALTRPTAQLSVLVETAFMTDKANLRLLMTPDGRRRFANAIAAGLEDFYRNQPGPGR